MADQIRPTPRSPILGLFSDLVNLPLQYMSAPQRTQQMQGVAEFIRSTGVPYALESLSYDPSGRGLFTGAGGLGGTTRLRPEAAEAALTVAPMVGPAARVAGRGAMAVGRAGERYAERVVPQIMERGGLPAEMVSAMGQGTQSPLTVYHGSPYRFDRFDPTKIGSGEGAQAYGYGHYVAEAPGVAKSYQPRSPEYEQKLLDKYNRAQARRDYPTMEILEDAMLHKTPDEIMQRFTNAEDGYTPAHAKAARDFVNWYGKNPPEVGGLYKVDLSDEQIARMIDYDKPLNQQPKEIQEKLKSVVDQQLGAGTWGQWIKTNPDFRDLQNDLLENVSKEKVAELIRQQGIPGIRYLDQGSRGTGQGTSNFVVFPGNEDLLRILEVNGEELLNPIMYRDPFGSTVR